MVGKDRGTEERGGGRRGGGDQSQHMKWGGKRGHGAVRKDILNTHCF